MAKVECQPLTNNGKPKGKPVRFNVKSNGNAVANGNAASNGNAAASALAPSAALVTSAAAMPVASAPAAPAPAPVVKAVVAKPILNKDAVNEVVGQIVAAAEIGVTKGTLNAFNTLIGTYKNAAIGAPQVDVIAESTKDIAGAARKVAASAQAFAKSPLMKGGRRKTHRKKHGKRSKTHKKHGKHHKKHSKTHKKHGKRSRKH